MSMLAGGQHADLGIVLRQCPVTSGLPTRMSAAGWVAACSARRESAKKYATKSWCGICQGRFRPQELEIIEIGENMGTKKIGKCESCGRTKTAVSHANNMSMCANCLTAYTAVRMRLEVVANAIRATGQEDRIAALLGWDAGERSGPPDVAARCDELAAEVAALTQQLVDEQGLSERARAIADKHWSILVDIRESIGGDVVNLNDMSDVPRMVREVLSQLDTHRTEMARIMAAVGIQDGNLAGYIQVMRSDMDGLRDKMAIASAKLAQLSELLEVEDGDDVLDELIAAAEVMMRADPKRLPSAVGSVPSASKPEAIDGLLLDLSLDVIRGAVTGLDPDRIAALREAAR